MASPGNWTERRIAALTRMAAEGSSGSEIADALGGISRNAVIGKANRLGIQLHGTVGRHQDAEAAIIARERKLRLQRERRARKASEPKPAVMVVPIIGPSTRPCLWPSGDRCTQPALEYRPYCEAHCRLAYQRPRARSA